MEINIHLHHGVVEEKTSIKDSENNFVKIFLEKHNSIARDNIMECISWLFEALESNNNTKDMVDLTKYLLYKITNSDYGVKEFDFNIFDPKNFKKVGNRRCTWRIFIGSCRIYSCIYGRKQLWVLFVWK